VKLAQYRGGPGVNSNQKERTHCLEDRESEKPNDSQEA